MAAANQPDKAKIVAEFETMKSYELSACDLYTRIAADPRVDQQRVRKVFKTLAADERRHADPAQEIIDLLRSAA